MKAKLVSKIMFLSALASLMSIQACEHAQCDAEQLHTDQKARSEDGVPGASASGGQDGQRGWDGQQGIVGLDGGHGGNGGHSEWGKGGDGGNGGDAD